MAELLMGGASGRASASNAGAVSGKTNGLILAIEIAFAIVLAYLAAQAFWLVANGAEPPASDTAQNLTISTPAAARINTDVIGSYDPFFRGNSSSIVAASAVEDEALAGEDAPETTLNLKLFGTRFSAAAGSDSIPSSAIIQDANGKQVSIAVGEDILDGVKLYSVNPFFVTLIREGKLERLSLDEGEALITSVSNTPAAKPGEPPQKPRLVIADKRKQMQVQNQQNASSRVRDLRRRQGPSISERDFQTLLNSVTMTPRIKGRTIEGWTMSPNGSGTLFLSLGLKDGDVLKRVNGRPMKNAERLTELIDDLNGVSRVALLVERGGQDVTVTFDYDG